MTSEEVFGQAMTQVLQDEGSELTDYPNDPGGKTKFGITQKLLTAVAPTLTVEDLTRDMAVTIYEDNFWREYKIDVIAGAAPRTAAKLFNFMVNVGPHAAGLCLQRALRANGETVKEDGVIGPITRATVTRTKDECVVAALKSECAGYYRSLHNPTEEKGWVDRAYREGM